GNPHEMHVGLWSSREFIRAILELGGEILALEKYEELTICMVSSRHADRVDEMITAPTEWFLRRFTGKYTNGVDERSLSQKLRSIAFASLGRILPRGVKRVIRRIIRAENNG
ncbi:MAG: hypothetical protein Q7U89_02120, partial [Coriobacteriia bacterium]|nr:hypothetical protein [Coriobacteriia bacterium]